ncbi:MAG: hypothetical protein MST03_09060 [Bacteroidales bacterium]|nr:hypothetical protein [Bacteroidales bacterium]
MENREDEKKLIEQIYKTHYHDCVLTSYRETWEDGKPGVLYFSAKNNALVKIDAPWRKGVSPEQLSLLPYELELMDNWHYWIAGGIFAFIMSGMFRSTNSLVNKISYFNCKTSLLFSRHFFDVYFEEFSNEEADFPEDIIIQDWEYTYKKSKALFLIDIESCYLADKEVLSNLMYTILKKVFVCHYFNLYDFDFKEIINDSTRYRLVYKYNNKIIKLYDWTGRYLLRPIDPPSVSHFVYNRGNGTPIMGGYSSCILMQFIQTVYAEKHYQDTIEDIIKEFYAARHPEMAFDTLDESTESSAETKIEDRYAQIDSSSTYAFRPYENQIETFSIYMDCAIEKLQKAFNAMPDIDLDLIDGVGIYGAFLEYEKFFRDLARQALPQYLPDKYVKSILKWTDNFIKFVERKCKELAVPKDLPTVLTPEFLAQFPHYKPVPQSAVESNSVKKPQPAPESGLPPKNSYVAVVTWLQQEKAEGRDYFQEAGKNRAKMCRNLSDIFKWEVDSNSLGKTLNRRN